MTPSSGDAASIVLDEVGHEFAQTGPLFAGLSTTLRAGETVALVGPSGSGKSTLLSILARWVVPTRGMIRQAHVRQVGWVFQNPHGVARRTALDHVALPLLAMGQTRSRAQEAATEILTEFGLSAVRDRQFRSLSGGEAQRLMLARAVALAPDLLLVDEPTAQLDRSTAATVNQVLSRLARDDTIVVVATHDARTRDACSRVIDLTDHQPGTA